jgi:tetratricopeptide (TPR) repeat protein
VPPRLELADAQLSVPEASAMAEQVAERARVAHDRRGEMVARVVTASHRLALASTGSAEELETLAREALPLLDEANDHAGLVRVWTALGDIANLHGHYEEWAHAAEQTIFHTQQIGGSGLFHLPDALVHGPRPADTALQELDGLLVQDPLPGPSPDRAVLLAMLGRFDEAWATVHEANRWVFELTGEEITDTEAEIATLAGDQEAAAGSWDAYCTMLERQGRRATLSTYAPRLGRSLCKLGRYDEAEPLADRGRQLGVEGDVVTQILWRQVQALVLSNRGEHAEAERLAREAAVIAEQTDTLNWQGDVLCDLAEVLQQAGREQEAAAMLKEALERYNRKRNLAMIAQVRQRLAAGENPIPAV